MEDPMTIDVNEIVAEMDDLGRAKFEAAHARVQVRKLQAEVARLSNAHATAAAGPTDGTIDDTEAGDGDSDG